jgi:ATP-dependent helicase IRC3
MTVSLRNYQLEAVEIVISSANAGITRQLISLPTGSGKTIIMSAIAKELNKRTLILAHRQELLTQTVDKLKLVWPGISIGMCQGDRDEIHNQVVVGSVQSCSRPKRLERLRAQGFELLMIDEAHHSVADTYQSIINTLGFNEGTSKLLVGVSATCDREGLGSIFDKITFSKSISTMINNGYLSPVMGRKILTNLPLEKIRTHNSDFAICDLAEAVNTSGRNQFIVEKFLEYAPKRKGIAFCCDVNHCKDLATEFQATGINCLAVWGDMPAEERQSALSDLKHGKIQLVTSCGVLTEGFDEASLSCVVMARPTKSQSLYIQCVGRGLRLYPSKENCLVLDFTDRFHNLDSVMSLTKTIPEAVHIEERKKVEDPEEVDHTPKIASFEEVDEEFDILGQQRFIWTDLGNDEWSLQDDDRNEIVIRLKGSGYVANLFYSDDSSIQIISEPLPLEYCQGCAEDYARRHLKIALADANAAWMNSNEPPTSGQRDYLEKLNAWDDSLTKAQAALEIRKQVALKNKIRRGLNNEPFTKKQKWFLDKHKIKTDNMTKLQAMREISKLKQKVSSIRRQSVDDGERNTSK